MRASYITGLAFLLLVVGRWAHNEKALNVQTIAGGAFVIIVIAALDNGSTEEIAKGLAWLILAAVALSKNSPLTAIATAANAKATGSTTVTAQQKAVGAGGPNA